jgi:hypothetical protein
MYKAQKLDYHKSIYLSLLLLVPASDCTQQPYILPLTHTHSIPLNCGVCNVNMIHTTYLQIHISAIWNTFGYKRSVKALDIY